MSYGEYFYICVCVCFFIVEILTNSNIVYICSDVDLINGEQKKEEFTKINPEHTLPTINDNGKILWDSHAIVAYLSDKYGKDDSLYPKDLYTRARVNQRLFFDASSLFPKVRGATYPIFFGKSGLPSQDKIDEIHKTYEHLEKFLATDPYLVGDQYTIADIAVANTVFVSAIYAPTEKYPKISAWLKRVDSNVPHFAEINGDTVNTLRGMVHAKVEQNKAQ